MAKRGRASGSKNQTQVLGDFAEDLGRFLGTAEHKARGWLDQRKSIASQLSQVRDKADQLLRELTGGAASMALTVTRSRRNRPLGSGKKAKRQGRTFTAAQRKQQAERMRAYWAKRKGKTAKRGRKAAKTFPDGTSRKS